ncbi:cytochrome P450 CYP72A219-like [Momordica charantia]|uniref:Cytochrome P450 CYP72A219-like n=1 Tax=Momordica charantia TaxID=3673 RepID=A0A6J1D398_MOMCH|nr:cytochrome P450 CYP72A219-like [Momordica charantia]
METSVEVVVSICMVLMSLVGWRVFDWLWLRPKRLQNFLTRQGFAGNSYRIFVGDLKELAAASGQARSNPMPTFSHDIAPRVVPSEYKTIQNYGKNSYMWLGPYPRVHIMDPTHLKATFTQIDEIQKPNFNPIVKLLLDGVLTYEGQKWAKHKKIISPAFYLLKLKDMVPKFIHTCNEMISDWERLISKEGWCEIDVMPYLHNLTADSISRTACGSSFKEGQIIFKLLKELTDLVVEAASRIYIPGWRFVPTKSNRKMKKIDREINTLLMGIINKRQKAMEKGELGAQSDLLGILLESNLREIEEHGNNKRDGMSIEEVVKECRIFYLAGQETTASLLIWTMLCLSLHKQWQDRARVEVLQVFGNKDPTFDGLSSLKVVTMIMNEVMRLYPPANTIHRVVQKETRLGNLTIPSGVILCIPVILIHRDREIWGDDAHEFKPERFSEGISNASKAQPGFLPFAWGPRICMGQNFAMMEAKIVFSIILQHFSFELSSSYTHAPTSIMTTQPQHGAHIILRKL